MPYQEHKITSDAAMQKFAQRFAKTLNPGTILVLTGDLGSGKTTFVKGLAIGLGVEEHVTSPTFLIMKSYPLPAGSTTLYHVDGYRIRDAQELLDLGFDEILEDPRAIVAFEWGERFPGILPKGYRQLEFAYKDRTTRVVCEIR